MMTKHAAFKIGKQRNLLTEDRFKNYVYLSFRCSIFDYSLSLITFALRLCKFCSKTKIGDEFHYC